MAVVEVDTETGKVEVLRFVACDDAGRILNPLLAEGQIQGGLAQGAAQALLEEVRYDEDGNPQNASLVTYGFPGATELPSFELVEMETPTPVNLLGAKGIGESGTIGATPAVHNGMVAYCECAVQRLSERYPDATDLLTEISRYDTPEQAFERSPTLNAIAWKRFRELMAGDEILEVHSVAGDDCYFIKVRTGSIPSLNTLLMKLAAAPLSLTTRTTIVMQTHCEKVGGIVLGEAGP